MSDLSDIRFTSVLSSEFERGDILEALDHFSMEENSHELALSALRKSKASECPLSYIIGSRGFLDRRYKVNADVLIPRFETELLVQCVFEIFESDLPQKLGLEIGVGCGVIACSLLEKFPELTMIGTDIAESALQLTQLNGGAIAEFSERFKGILSGESSVFFPDALRSLAPFDFIVSNPPYLEPNDEICSQVLKHEPHHALFPSGGPLAFYTQASQIGADLLRPGGFLICEIAHERATQTREIFLNQTWKACFLHNDLTGRPRFLVAQRSV